MVLKVYGVNPGEGRTIVVTGATGRQGSGVVRALLRDRWHVRALTRNPASAKAQMLAELGADVVQGDMENVDSLRPVFEGAYGAFSVQNPMISGLNGEIRQGKLVADVAKEVGIQHLVYASAGTGKPTGIGSWDSKLEVEAHMKALDIPLTVLRPKAFMELMTDKGYYPQVSTWHLMPKLMGWTRPVSWFAASDVGIVVASIFAAPERYLGHNIQLASDVKTLNECRALYVDVLGKKPPRFPMPVWLFKRFVGDDLLTMWIWLKTGEISLETEPALAVHPAAKNVETWLRQQVPEVQQPAGNALSL